MNRAVRAFGWFALVLFATGAIIDRATDGSSSSATGVLPLPPPSLVDDLLRTFPERDVVILTSGRRCGSPFLTILNYLTKKSAEEPSFPGSLGLITASEGVALTRELDQRFGAGIRIDDEMVDLGLPYGNALVIERSSETDDPVVHQFDVDLTGEVVEALDRIFDSR